MTTETLYVEMKKEKVTGKHSELLVQIFLVGGIKFRVECTRGGNATFQFPIKTFTKRAYAISYGTSFLQTITG